jgi:hypothetical protein
MPEAIIGIGADLSVLQDQLADLPKLAGKEAEKAVREIQRLARRSAAQITRAVKAESKAQVNAQKAAKRAALDAAKASEKAANEAREAGKGLAELAGIPADKFEKLRAVAAGLGSPLGLAAIAATGAALAVGGFAVAAVGSVRAAQDLVVELEHLQALEGFGISAGSLASIEAANAGMDALGNIASQAVIVLASDFAPGIATGADLLVRFGLAGLDAFQALQNGEGIIRSFAITIVDNLVQGMVAPISQLMSLIEVMGDLASAVGLDGVGGALQRTGQRWDDFTREISAGIVDKAIGATSDAVGALDEATAGYADRSKELISTVAAHTRAERDGASAIRDKTGALKEAQAALKAMAENVQLLADADRQLSFWEGLSQIPQITPTSEQVTRFRELGAAVDLVAPPEALPRIDALNLLLDELEYSAARAGDAGGALADNIARVKSAIVDEGAMAALKEQEAAVKATGDAMAAAEAESAAMASGVASAISGAGPLGDLVGALATGDPVAAIGTILNEVGKGAKGGRAMARMAADFITGIAKGIGPFVAAFASNMDEIFVAFAKFPFQLVKGIVTAIPEIGRGIAEAYIAGIKAQARQLFRLFSDIFKEIATGGRAETRTFGDTPGPVRMNTPTRASFASGDYVVAARSREGLERQVGGGGAGGSMTVTTVLDVRDGPVRLGMATATRRELTRAGVGRDTTGRRTPYATL